MRTRFVYLRAIVGITLLGVALGAQAQTLNTLYTFTGGANGANPVGQLVADGHGNFYGVTQAGGNVASACLNGCGTVFELSPNGSGGWTQTVIFSFTDADGLGYGPFNLTMDRHGNLFGTAIAGGQSTNSLCGLSGGCGMVFELTHGAGGWTESVIHSFQGFPNDGQFPSGNILIDAKGNLYGTTMMGGIGTQFQCYASGCGTVWELSPMPGGHWKEKIIHNFLGLTYGQYPAGLVTDASGNLYGATWYGGFGQRGTIFKLSPTANGWIGGIIFRLNGTLGDFPMSDVALDPQGDIFVSTSGFGPQIVELTPTASGWSGQAIGAFPQGTILLHGLTTDAQGHIYGTTTSTLFELEMVNGSLQIVTLTNMDGENAGTYPGLPIFDASGNLFGIDGVGQGTAQYGTVYEITP